VSFGANNVGSAWCLSDWYASAMAVTVCSSFSCIVIDRYFTSAAGVTPMQIFNTSAVALIVLCVADEFLSAGYYTQAVCGVLKHASLTIGVHV
jgi:hypothetical protein